MSIRNSRISRKSRNSRNTRKSVKSNRTYKSLYSLKIVPKEEERKRKKIMPTLSLGTIPPGYVSNIKFAKDEELEDFINNEIKYGPQIVSLPVPPQRHAFLVDVQKSKIMVSDWGGEENKELGTEYISGKKNKQYIPAFKQYSDFLTKLEDKYNKNIEYYPIDDELHEKAYEFSKQCNDSGGCADYIYAWKKKYYPEYR